ncbi:MAG: OmpA family protein [Spirochaetaceae bacterium]|jgi:outer membrane protein OmpA-like peptidoglycan-associated protein|nr:OmpA family protein [Spirochaetaceae bacterium]
MIQKRIVFFLLFFAFIPGLYAQTDPATKSGQSLWEFPAGNYWSLDAGLGMTGILVKGQSYQFIVDPKLWLSPPLMVGSKVGVSYSTDAEARNILTFEGQVYLRWNFLRLGKNPEKKVNIFLQGGLGLLSAYRGKDNNPIDDVTQTRGSLMADAAAGVTIPLTPRWHIEPSIRGGYPHIAGFGITAGYKFPLPQGVKGQSSVEHVELIRTLPPNEIIKRIMISAVEFILFGPDIGRYNVGIDHDAQGLNELVLNSIAKMLKENPDFRVRIEGHANPITTDPKEADILMALSSQRANAVVAQLKARGVNEEQMVVIAFGGTRTVTHDHDIWNRNRRVELIVIQVNTD